MALFSKGKPNVLEEVKKMKGEGLSDNQIIDELRANGYNFGEINDALARAAIADPNAPLGEEGQIQPPPGMEEPAMNNVGVQESSGGINPEEIEGRIEEIAESIIDEKWDLLVEEVKKIVEWKEKVEGEVKELKGEISHLKDNFSDLHQGVLGKLESYDDRMTEVGTELKAVGKVFKDVIPEFVENVKELKAVTKKVKNK